jgi:hypothetical protein
MPPQALPPETLTILAFAVALAGLTCFLWPSFQRLSGRADATAQGAQKTIRSPLWWAGFVLTAIALMLQRMAAGGA